MEEKDKLEQPQEERAKSKRKIVSLIVIIGLIIDIILLIVFLILRFNYKKNNNSSNQSIDMTSEYISQADNLKTKLLNIMNYHIDNDLSKTDEKYDVSSLISISTNDNNEVIYTGYNNDYVVSLNIKLDNLNNFINDINNDNYTNVTISFLDKDKIAVNPLNDDNDFKQIKKNNLSYVVATNGASKRNLSASYFNIDENKYYSITNYQYDNGDFHFNNITSNNMTSYSLEENPIIYHLFLL